MKHIVTGIISRVGCGSVSIDVCVNAIPFEPLPKRIERVEVPVFDDDSARKLGGRIGREVRITVELTEAEP